MKDETNLNDQNHMGIAKGSLDLIYALNHIATALQESIRSEENVYAIFQEQVIALGLRGGISEYDEQEQTLNFKTVAFTNPLRKMLSRFEKGVKIKAKGYTIKVARVDVYDRVVHQAQAVFVQDTSTVSAQVVPREIKAVVKPLLTFLGQPPGIFAPLVYDGKVKGMLNIVGVNLTAQDIPAMQAFANQIAVALENTRLVKELQTANDALEAAYQKTLEGWVQALDMRDNETEGHTLRVADTTVRLASYMGVAQHALDHVRQGALLHDIGKMAVPDAILHKPGPLSDSEWSVMRLHPVTAYAWLKNIEYLGPAIDIPYCHHEHWDGGGYPQGLQQDQIPFWSRVFTIVDVWDAMRSDRPYRGPIPENETLQFLRDQTGKLFDPQVSEAFFDLLAETPEVREIHHS